MSCPGSRGKGERAQHVRKSGRAHGGYFAAVIGAVSSDRFPDATTAVSRHPGFTDDILSGK
ncbi:MAG: hypothetical protein APR53_08825 [Methanoculleus sp. SDB]|nr:MAG: hypothetical protein APR53_08825 [Methanoculleus sp. SDB]